MDVDIDLHKSFKPENYFNVTGASRIHNDVIKKHNVGVYFQKIPVDPISKLSAIPYKNAEDFGYLKIDFLHLEVLDHFQNNNQIRTLANIEPDWSLLEVEENVKKLFQIKNQFWLINRIKPKTVDDLADCLALMRPGKKHLIDMYMQNKDEVKKILYIKDSNFSFKRSHAIAYATTIVLELHLLKGGII